MKKAEITKRMRLRNLAKALWEQGPFKRFVRNFFVTGNALGMFSKRSHLTESGKAKVMYNTKKTAEKSAKKLSEKHGKHFSHYKCVFCDGYHLGKNRDNK